MKDLLAQKPPSPGGLTVAQPAKPPAPAAPAVKLKPEERAAIMKANGGAQVIAQASFPSAMSAAIPLGAKVGASAFRVYLNRLVNQAGNPSDPIEIMMVEQLAMAHHRVAQLHVHVEQSQNIDERKVYLSAANRLTGEFRRLALALKQYREPSSKKQFTVVRQQNVAAGHQQIALVTQDNLDKVPLASQDGELVSRRLQNGQPFPLPESPAGGGWAEEPALTRSLDLPGASAAAGGGQAQ